MTLKGLMTMKGCISCRKTKKGEKRYYVIVDLPTAPGEKRKQKWSKAFLSHKEATKALPNILLEVQASNYTSSQLLMFHTVIQNYLSKCEGELAKSTYKRYKSCCKLIDEELGLYPIKKLEPHMIHQFFERLKKKDYTPNTIQKYKAVLQQIILYATELRIIDHSPVPKLKVRGQSSNTEHETWSKTQLHDFLRCLKGEPIYIPVLLAGTTGMRCGEIVGLKWKDIDFETNTLRVMRSKTFDDSLKIPKTKASKRPIKLIDWVADELKKYQLSQKTNRIKYGKDYIKSDFVCTLENGKPLNTNYVTKTFPRKVAQHHFDKIRFHDLRHTFATIALANGIHPKVVQEILGHSNIKVTLDTYSHVLPVVHTDSMEKITKAFS